jgi:hypothetical protein
MPSPGWVFYCCAVCLNVQCAERQTFFDCVVVPAASLLLSVVLVTVSVVLVTSVVGCCSEHAWLKHALLIELFLIQPCKDVRGAFELHPQGFISDQPCELSSVLIRCPLHVDPSPIHNPTKRCNNKLCRSTRFARVPPNGTIH